MSDRREKKGTELSINEKRKILCGMFAKGSAVRIHTKTAVLDLDFIGRWTFQAYNTRDLTEGRPKIYFYESILEAFADDEKII